jgi:hypothetical protein
MGIHCCPFHHQRPSGLIGAGAWAGCHAFGCCGSAFGCRDNAFGCCGQA